MNDITRHIAPVTVCAMLALLNIADAQSPAPIPPSISTPDKVNSRLGILEFKDGVPNKATAEKVYDNLDFTYAFEAFIEQLAAASASTPCAKVCKTSG